ncbi:hypothetical protein FRC17_003472 [Serendipita sp. 399]|nr:hypothetical protein FRC17_003472 [Serendipita sp. 399]
MTDKGEVDTITDINIDSVSELDIDADSGDGHGHSDGPITLRTTTSLQALKMENSAIWKESIASAGFTGDLVVPSDADYDSALNRFARNARRNAGLVAFAKSPQDVSLVINHASTNRIPLVIRGGGHSTSGSSSTQGGIVVDLSRHLNTVRVDEANKLGYVGGGADWAAVDAETIKYGLATVGGTVNHTGVVQATIVTADGSILTVNETTNSDLFWGIRGGGCNFGCVTEFVFKLHPQPRHVFAGPLIFPYPRIAEVAIAAEQWYASAGDKEGLVIITTNKGMSGGPELVVIVFFNGDEDEGRRRYKPLFDLGPIMSLAGMIPFEKLNAMQNDNISYGQNYHLTGFTRPSLPPDVASKAFDMLVEIANAPSEADLQMVLIWEYHILRKLSSVSPDATAFPMRVQRPLTVMLVTWNKDSDQLTADAKSRLKRLQAFCEGALASVFDEKGGKTAYDTGYTNTEMGDPGSVDVARAMYGTNYPRLQQLKKKYDPNMMFKTWYPILPAA